MLRQKCDRASRVRLGLAALLLGLLGLLPSRAYAVTACGGANQRACCTGDRDLVKFGSCDGDLHQVLGCSSDDCICGGFNPFGTKSLGICRGEITACGAAGQRACCGSDRDLIKFGSCDAGSTETGTCTGNCTCADFVFSSAGVCKAVSACGGAGQRACCDGDRSLLLFGSCDSGTTEAGTCTGDCLCKGGLSSIGICQVVAPCGADGQRACCGTDRNLLEKGSCDAGTSEIGGCSGNCLCGSGLGVKSSGTCKAVTHCGNEGERACCALTEQVPSCNGTLSEVGTCSGDCRCSGSGSSIGMCHQVTPCGGEGQRACCFFERVPSCDGDLFEMPFCAGDCFCKVGGSATGTCAKATPCGGKGQRSCCAVERATPCNSGLTFVPGCSGDCFCKGSGETSSGTCTVTESIPEPGTQFTPQGPPQCVMRGYADMHLHLFGELAHGGGVLAGKAYDPVGGINAALRQDFGTNADLVSNQDKELSAPDCPSYLPNCGKVVWHGDHSVLADATGDGTKDGSGSNLGAPAFNGWPKWTSTTHQQAYYKWLERAYRGGLRLTVMLAVTNESLCKLSPHLRGTNCENSMAPIDAQLAEARRFSDFIDAQSGGTGQGWFRIVTTPTEARRVIRDGKLAVVLGIEVAALFNCKNSANCTEAFVRSEVQRYQKMGVRHIFPIHNFDNGFGAAATWQDSINLGNALAEGRYWETDNTCFFQGYGFWLDTLGESFIRLIGGVAKGLNLPPTPIYLRGDVAPYASCNAFGLKPLGRALIDELMNQKMLIDIDHMSNRSLDETVALARPRGYPLLASHVQMFDLHNQQFEGNAGRHERMRTQAQLQAIRDSGGMIAAMLKDDIQDTNLKGKKSDLPFGSVSNDCRYSSRAFAQMYQYAVDRMGGAPVAFGSDFNGIAGHLGPRFGSDACSGDGKERSTQARSGTRLAYPFTLPGFGQLDRQVTGQKTFDYNVDGLAHIGLLPDLVADLKAVGLSDQQLLPLMRSAEGYIETWERAVGADGGATRTRCVSRTVVADAACQTGASIADPSLLEDTSVTLVQSPAGPYAGGTQTVMLTVTPKNGCGPSFSCSAQVTVEDKTPPKVTCPAPAPAECTGAMTPVSFPDPMIVDNCGASLDSCTIKSGSGFAFGTTAVSCTVRDGGGNTNSCGFQVVVRDTTPPSLTCPAPIVAECTGGGGATVDPGMAVGSDLCGPVSVPRRPPARYPVGITQVTHTAVDQVGLPASCTGTVEVRDTTPPKVMCPQQVIGECGQPLSYTVAASDVCDGVPGLKCNPAIGAALTVGTYSGQCTVTDKAGNAASCNVPVTIKDTAGPVFDPKTLAQTVIGNCSGQPVAFAFSARDACSPAVVQCGKVSGTSFGKNTVACTATDAAGNVSKATLSVTVLEPLRVVFHRPLRDDNLPDNVDTDADIANRFRAGQNVPHHVRLYGCGGYHLTRRAAVTVRLRVNAGEKGEGAELDGGLMVLKGGHYKFNLHTSRKDYTADAYRSLVTVAYDSAPMLIAGQEDARLVRSTGRDCVDEDDGDDDDDDRDDDDRGPGHH